ncbi:type II toxin-antitoxin system ParD family antitoxin [Leptolyngbyaceae cyanobacterium UHCC 1019]
MQIMLSIEQEQFIQTQIQRGIFASPDQAIAAALRLLEAQSQGHEQWVREVKAKVDEAAAELARGEGIPLETVVGQIEQKFRKAREAQA